MSARGPHTRLICLALFGTLVISCGGPSVSAIPSAPPPAAERVLETVLPPPEDGLTEIPEPASEPAPPLAPRAAPAPAPPPAQQPVIPPRRPGGAPPGAALVTVPGGPGDRLSSWREELDDACNDAKQPPGCLTLDIRHFDRDGERIHLDEDEDGGCEITSQDPDIGAVVPTSRSIKLDVECDVDTDSDPGSGTDPDPGSDPDPNTEGN